MKQSGVPVARARAGILDTRRKTGRAGSLAVTSWAPTVTPWSLQSPHPGPEAVSTEAACRAPGTAPGFTYPAAGSAQACHTHAKPRAAGPGAAGPVIRPPGGLGQVARPKTLGWWAQNLSPKLPEQVLARTPACAQQTSRSKTQPIPKTNTGKQTQEVTPTGQRSPEAPAQDAAQDLTRHEDTAPAGDGSRKGKGVSHFRYNCKRVSKEDGGRAFWSLAAGLFLFFVFCLF